MYVERNVVGRYGAKDFDDSDNERDNGNYTVWVIGKDVNVVTPYTYDEAISLAGHGPYTVGLLAVCIVSLLGFCLDMFGFATVVSGSSCDLEIGQWQHNVLLSIPFLGAISTTYVWGYVSDTRGRRLSLLITMWGAFIASTASAFSPNWVVLAVLRFISVNFCNCAQSATYTLIGESCPVNVKGTYFYILNSVVHLVMPIYTALGYALLSLSFSFNLGFITFTPWRLLVLCLALPLGVSAVCYNFIYESPKFLANAGENAQALENLRGIWKRNRCVGKKYPVEKLILEEVGNTTTKNMPLLKSMWGQTVPLFRKPYLSRALQLFFLSILMYGVSNSLLMLFPFLVNAFISGTSSDGVPEGMCKVIEHSLSNSSIASNLSCTHKSDLTVVWASAIQGVVLTAFNISICWVSNRKVLVIMMMTILSIASVGCGFIESNVISLFLFFTIFMTMVVNGILSSYYVDFFPTSFRGMAACLAVLIGRTSGLVASRVSGFFVISHCSITFYVIAFLIFCGVVVACFLPSDKDESLKAQNKQRKCSNQE